MISFVLFSVMILSNLLYKYFIIRYLLFLVLIMIVLCNRGKILNIIRELKE